MTPPKDSDTVSRMHRVMVRSLSTALVAAVYAALAACSSGDDAPPAQGSPDAAVPDQLASPEAEPGQDVAVEPALDAPAQDGGPKTGLSIAFDFRFDKKGLFDSSDRKSALLAAASMWSAALHDDFADIPAGTEVLVRDPQAPSVAGQVFVYDQPIDDLAVFVGFASMDGAHGSLAISAPSAAIGSVSDPALRASLKQRYEGADFEPWTGWLGFDEGEDWFFDPTPHTSDDLPASKVDFLSVALHELGHILGVGTSDAFLALVQNGSFVGPNAMAANGGPVPLTPDGKHIAAGLLSEGKRPVMDESDSAGARSEITSLDLAILRDIGYQTAP